MLNKIQITITKSASKAIQQLLPKILKVNFINGGCAGLKWQLSVSDEKLPKYEKIKIDDCIILIHEEYTHIPFQIDYIQNLMASEFVLKISTNASCRCGISVSRRQYV